MRRTQAPNPSAFPFIRMNPFTDEYYMGLALQQAQRAFEADEVPIGAVVVGNARLLAKGHNQTETLVDPTAHAEMIALTAACNAIGGKYLHGCTLYVTVEPCPMCAAALRWAQISRLVYGAQEPKVGYTTVSHQLVHPKTEVESGVLADECSALMREFFRAKRR